VIIGDVPLAVRLVRAQHHHAAHRHEDHTPGHTHGSLSFAAGDTQLLYAPPSHLVRITSGYRPYNAGGGMIYNRSGQYDS
jgi:hypothetical protein